MVEETKEAVRLLLECANEIRLHEEGSHHRTGDEFKARLLKFFEKHKVGNPEDAARELCLPF